MSGADVQRIATTFGTHFSNRVYIVHLEQKGPFGQLSRITIPFDPAVLNPDNIKVYVYDEEQNTYGEFFTFKIVGNTVVFETHVGGDIILSNGYLSKK